jgi:hypothetical protein
VQIVELRDVIVEDVEVVQHAQLSDAIVVDAAITTPDVEAQAGPLVELRGVVELREAIAKTTRERGNATRGPSRRVRGGSTAKESRLFCERTRRFVGKRGCRPSHSRFEQRHESRRTKRLH